MKKIYLLTLREIESLDLICVLASYSTEKKARLDIEKGFFKPVQGQKLCVEPLNLY